jgi:hypothetical protein
VPEPRMSESRSGDKSEKRPRKRRTNTLLVFDAAQKVPDHVKKAIIEEWLIPCLVEEVLSELRTRARLAARAPEPLGP